MLLQPWNLIRRVLRFPTRIRMTSRSVHIGQICQKFECGDKQMARWFHMSTFYPSFNEEYIFCLSKIGCAPVLTLIIDQQGPGLCQFKIHSFTCWHHVFITVYITRILLKIHVHTAALFTSPSRALWVPRSFNISDNLSQFLLHWSKTKPYLHKRLECTPSQRWSVMQ
jgi:hypothetical protein